MAPPKVVHFLQKYPELRAAFYPSLMPEEESAVSALLMLKNQPPRQITKKRKERDSTAPENENVVYPVSVNDCETGHVFELKFKFWASSNSYAFVDGWRKNFVKRRRLKEGDEIGIIWRQREEQIFFSVLQRASRAVNQ